MPHSRQPEWKNVLGKLRKTIIWNEAYLYDQPAWGYASRQVWVNTWMSQYDKGRATEEVAGPNILEQFLREYAQKVWYKRLWAWLTQPITRLKRIHAHQELALACEANKKWNKQQLTNIAQALHKLQKTLSFISIRRWQLSTIQKQVVAHIKRMKPMESSVARHNFITLGSAIRSIFRKILSYLDQHGKEKVSIFKTETHAALAQRLELISEPACQAFREKLAITTLNDKAYKAFPGWLGRFNQTKDPEYTKHRRLVYYQSLKLYLEKLVTNKIFESSSWNELSQLLSEGLMLGAKQNGEKVDKEVWNIYRKCVRDLIQLNDDGITKPNNDLTEWLKKIAINLRDLLNDSNKKGQDQNDIPIPIQAENRLRILIPIWREYQKESREIDEHFGRLNNRYVDAKEQLLNISQTIHDTLEALQTRINQLGLMSAPIHLDDPTDASYAKTLRNLINSYYTLIEDLRSNEANASRAELTLPVVEPILQLTEEDRKACKQLGLDPEQAIYWSMIRKAYKKKAKYCHPDKKHDVSPEKAKEIFQQLQEVYQQLQKFKDIKDSQAYSQFTSTDLSDIAKEYKETRREGENFEKWFNEQMKEQEKRFEERITKLERGQAFSRHAEGNGAHSQSSSNFFQSSQSSHQEQETHCHTPNNQNG